MSNVPDQNNPNMGIQANAQIVVNTNQPQLAPQIVQQQPVAITNLQVQASGNIAVNANVIQSPQFVPQQIVPQQAVIAVNGVQAPVLQAPMLQGYQAAAPMPGAPVAGNAPVSQYTAEHPMCQNPDVVSKMYTAYQDKPLIEVDGQNIMVEQVDLSPITVVTSGNIEIAQEILNDQITCGEILCTQRAPIFMECHKPCAIATFCGGSGLWFVCFYGLQRPDCCQVLLSGITMTISCPMLIGCIFGIQTGIKMLKAKPE